MIFVKMSMIPALRGEKRIVDCGIHLIIPTAVRDIVVGLFVYLFLTTFADLLQILCVQGCLVNDSCLTRFVAKMT
jgi:hypothetical protein